jgi:hypothetical protein
VCEFLEGFKRWDGVAVLYSGDVTMDETNAFFDVASRMAQTPSPTSMWELSHGARKSPPSFKVGKISLGDPVIDRR